MAGDRGRKNRLIWISVVGRSMAEDVPVTMPRLKNDGGIASAGVTECVDQHPGRVASHLVGKADTLVAIVALDLEIHLVDDAADIETQLPFSANPAARGLHMKPKPRLNR